MKKSVLIILIPAAVIALIISISWSTQKMTRREPQGMAVVELFTSEGCSSCPAADDAVARIAAKYADQVFVLGFHVDYWNRLGWKDQYSNASYSERQRWYATSVQGDGIYTPQVIVNGEKHFVGSSEGSIRKSIDEYISAHGSTSPALRAEKKGDGEIGVNYSFDNQKDVLNIALVQLHTETLVRGGENKGRTLQHINIVRDFKTVSNGRGSVALVVPSSLEAKDISVIGYTQNRRTRQITGVKEITVDQ